MIWETVIGGIKGHAGVSTMAYTYIYILFIYYFLCVFSCAIVIDIRVQGNRWHKAWIVHGKPQTPNPSH